MRNFIATILLFFTFNTIVSAQESAWYLEPFSYSLYKEGQLNTFGIQTERLIVEAENAKVSAFLFKPQTLEFMNYLKRFGATVQTQLEKITPVLTSGSSSDVGLFIIAKSDKPTDFTATFGYVEYKIDADQELDENTRKLAELYYAIVSGIWCNRMSQINAPGWQVFQMQQESLDKITAEQLKLNGIEAEFIPQKETVERFGMPRNMITAPFDFFSGVSAIERNLDLNDRMNFTGIRERTINVERVPGISVDEIDWKSLIDDSSRPKLDPLARFVPEDQHYVVFRTVKDAQSVLHKVDKIGLHAFVSPVSGLGATFLGSKPSFLERYFQQLKLTPEIFDALVENVNVKSVAITGSDPYLYEGTDIAFIFETNQPDKLVEEFKGRADFVRIAPNAVMLCNSPTQTDRILQTAAGKAPSLVELDEFRYFRDRYKFDDPEETVFVFLSDATIRRWCSPRWRIGQTRRLEQKNRLVFLNEKHFSELVLNKTNSLETVSYVGQDVDPDLQAEYTYTPTASGYKNDVYGTYVSMTPIIDLHIDKISAQEQTAYETWRRRFESTWQGKFDPIAIRLCIGENEIKTDLTIMPLNQSTLRNLRWIIDNVTTLPENAPSYSVSGQTILGVNLTPLENSEPRVYAFISVEQLAWLDGYITVYADFEPEYFMHLEKNKPKKIVRFARQENATATEQEKPKEPDFVPLVIEIGSKDSKKSKKFLLDMLSEFSSHPNELTYHEYNGQEYMAIENIMNTSVYAAACENRLLVAFNESAMKRAIDKKPMSGAESSWNGATFAMKLDRFGLNVFDQFMKQQADQAIAKAKNRNAYIYEYYNKNYPNASAQEIHARLFGEILLKPNEITVESPLEELDGIRFEATLDDNNLRVRSWVQYY